MWLLSKLEIRGFKSFAEPSELIFPAGITAVVGPNGCGKSNISDAIVWVLGEQSTNVLRAQRMEDVIFQGTTNRRPTGMAEVSLHLGRLENAPSGNGIGVSTNDSIKGDVTHLGAEGNGRSHSCEDVQMDGAPVFGLGDSLDELADDQIVITRRLFRSGDSEYLINGNRCRLRDVRDRLLGTGLGTRACFTIEQGRIDQILSASALDRRRPIEEAAGISLYRRQRHITNLKLDATVQDLARVDDICDEVGRQMRSLKRQAGKARRYKLLRTRLRALEGRHYFHELSAAGGRLAAAEAGVCGARAAEETARSDLETAMLAWEQARQRWRQRRQMQAERRQALYTAQVDLERLKAEQARQDDRASFATDRLHELEARFEELDEQLKEIRDVVDVREEAARQAAMVADAAESDLVAARQHLATVEAQAEAETEEHAAAVAAAEEASLAIQLQPLIADLEVEERWRGAVALALGALLHAPVLESRHVPTWLSALQRRGTSGRGVLPLEPEPVGDDAAPSLPLAPEMIALLADVALATESNRDVLRMLLANTWVVESMEEVLMLSQRHPSFAFVDTGGELWACGAELRYRHATTAVDPWSKETPRPQVVEVPSREAIPLVEDDQVEDAGGSAVERMAREACDRAAASFRAASAAGEAARREADSAAADLNRVGAGRGRTEEQIQGLIRTLDESHSKRDNVAEQLEASSRQSAELQRKVGTGIENPGPEWEVAGLEAAVTATRQAVERAQQRRSALEVKAAEVRVGVQHLKNQIRDRLQLEPEELLATMRGGKTQEADEPGERLRGLAPVEEIEPPALAAVIRQTHETIDRLGPVNLVAYEDYQTQEERFSDLDGQRRDLRSAVDNLREAINQIDSECVDRFREAFDAIDGYFNRVFRQLFGGGRASMRLEDPDDILGSGIEIAARPPGKNLQNIRLMSGGERSLVALALMFAIFEYHPSPFCILDEADAALDDSNIGRFVKALYHFRDRAQFILITHNKRSMEAAELLYGVTMQEDGVSQLVSVELN